MFEDVSVSHKAQGSEYHHDRHFLSDVWQHGDHPLADGALPSTLDGKKRICFKFTNTLSVKFESDGGSYPFYLVSNGNH